jgi:FkbM family methyltransferase
MAYWLRHVATRPRAFLRSCRALGIRATLSLVRIRLGSREKTYRLRVRPWRYPVYLRGGSSTDAFVLYEILATGEYESVKDLLEPHFIIDGGANIGFASLHFAHLFPKAHIVAVEPDEQNLELCRRNLSPFSDRITILQGAVWSRPGRLFLQPHSEEWAKTVRDPRDGEEGSVEVFTIPAIISEFGNSRPVDLLKLDVEGSEREIFGPDSREWLSTVSNIVIELHGPECEQRFFSALEPFRYDLTRRDAVCFCFGLRSRPEASAASPGI